MKKGIWYGEIINDLLNLYCKTGSSPIEDIYIKFAQNYSQNFSKWLSHNKSLKNDLSNPSVYSALETLEFLREKVGQNPPMSSIVRAITTEVAQKHLTNLPIIMAFGKLLGGDANNILLPFKDIISGITSQVRMVEDQDIENPEKILSDLLILQKSFLQEKKPAFEKGRIGTPSITQQRQEMFIYLLRRFSNELASASDLSGLTEIAQKFRDGILTVPPPIGIGEYIELKSITDSQMEECKKMADYVFKYPSSKYSNYLHDVIEIQFLQQAGSITKEDVYRFKETYEKQRSLLKVINEDQIKEDTGFDTEGKITGNARLNPDYIYMLSVFFMFMERKLKIPPSALVMI